jgi:hypothetical protein
MFIESSDQISLVFKNIRVLEVHGDLLDALFCGFYFVCDLKYPQVLSFFHEKLFVFEKLNVTRTNNYISLLANAAI